MGHNGTNKCTVDGSCRYSLDIPQGDLKYPVFLPLLHKILQKIIKQKKLIELGLNLSLKNSQMLIPVQSETYLADLASAISDERENIFFKMTR